MVIPATSTTSSDLHKQPGKNGKQPKDQQPKGPLELAETDKLFCSSLYSSLWLLVNITLGGQYSIQFQWSRATIFTKAYMYYYNPVFSKPSHRPDGKMQLVQVWSVQLVIGWIVLLCEVVVASGVIIVSGVVGSGVVVGGSVVVGSSVEGVVVVEAGGCVGNLAFGCLSCHLPSKQSKLFSPTGKIELLMKKVFSMLAINYVREVVGSEVSHSSGRDLVGTCFLIWNAPPAACLGKS